MCAIKGCAEPAEFAGLCRDHGRNLLALLNDGPPSIAPDQAELSAGALSMEVLEMMADRARAALKSVGG